MLITEWAKLTNRNPEDIQDTEWELVTTVYTFHPAIPDLGGKDTIAKLWSIGGCGIIQEMLPIAQQCMEHENKIQLCNVEIDKHRQALKEISKHFRV
jgi:hypothetical protein